jgi:hypothetical protein
MKFTTTAILFMSLISFVYALQPVVRSDDTILITRDFEVASRATFDDDASLARELYERVFYDILSSEHPRDYDDDDLFERDYFLALPSREEEDMEDYFARDYQLQTLTSRGVAGVAGKIAGKVLKKEAPKVVGQLGGSKPAGAPKTGAGKALEVAKDTKTAVGLITDGVGLATDVATGDVPKAVFDAIKLTVDGVIAAFHAISDAIAQDKYARSGFTQDTVAKLRAKSPKMNFVICHTAHHYKFPGVKGKNWYHEHRELNVKFPVGSTIGYEIDGFPSGEFFREGDGGYLNWAYSGNVQHTDDSGKHVVFGTL